MTAPILAYITVFTYLIPVITGGIRYKSLRSSERIFLSYCVVLMLGVFIEVTASLLGIHNHFIINVFRLFDVLIFTFYFSKTTTTKIFKIIASVSAILFLGVWICTNIVYTQMNVFNTVDAFVSGVLYLILAGILLFVTVHKVEKRSTRLPAFWVAFGVIIYNSGSIMVLAFSNTLLEQGIELFNIAWHINWTLCIVSNLMYSYSFLLHDHE
jgi:hypothetical protein